MSDLPDRLYLQMLVVRCQVGDRVAFEELVAHYQPRVRGFLYKILSNQQRVDDLAQEVWLDVFRDLPRLNDPRAFLPWMYRIARNRVFRELRKRREPCQSLDDKSIVDGSEEPFEFSADDAQAVHAALERLSAEHREVLLLRFIENMSYEDIAAVIGRQVGTVRSRLHHAKRALKRILENGD